MAEDLRLLDDAMCDPAPDLVEAVEALLMAAEFIPRYRDGGSIRVVDRRRLMWLHRALQYHRGEPLIDYSAYCREVPRG